MAHDGKVTAYRKADGKRPFFFFPITYLAVTVITCRLSVGGNAHCALCVVFLVFFFFFSEMHIIKKVLYFSQEVFLPLSISVSVLSVSCRV